MNGKTQANRLSELMQNKGTLPSYELALPLVTVRSSSLKKLASEDVLLLGLSRLECVLIQDGTVCANVVLNKQNKRHVLEVVEKNEVIKHNESKKYEHIKLSFGMIQSRVISMGHTIDLAQIDVNNVSLVLNEKKIATASLINVDGEIAVKIDKVEI
ncbi:hypothetical protein C9926_00025 [Sulfurovum lithotrophicum]|nr:hypothetical protein C9926_00025 [Sulfurovum lithotrophicum]